MTHLDLRKKYFDFWTSPPRNHKIIPPAPLVLQNDPTTLFTSSGMQPLVPYLLGQKHPLGNRLVDIQPAFRAQGLNDDAIEVGDNRHLTYFEMLGNWSLGDYFKAEQIENFFIFLTDKKIGLGLDPKRLYVSVFKGNEQIPKDTESVEIWKKVFSKVGINAEEDERIFSYDEKKNWWSRSGVPKLMPIGEPGGPDSEVFFDFGEELKIHENSLYRDNDCHPNCDCGRYMEIGNSVFMQYIKQADGSFKELPNKNVDFGGGLERIAAAVNNDLDIYKTDLFWPVISEIEDVSGKSYHANIKPMRIIADHMRGAVMLLSQNVYPDNKSHGSLLRKLIIRIISQGEILEIHSKDLGMIALKTIENYSAVYPELNNIKSQVSNIFNSEFERYGKKISEGKKRLPKELEKINNIRNDDEKLREFIDQKLSPFNATSESVRDLVYNTYNNKPNLTDVASGTVAFISNATYGLPFEESANIISSEVPGSDPASITYTSSTVYNLHRDLSRTASQGKFKGGLADQSETVVKYHTATHLFQAALRKVLGDGVHQEGSNITGERMRFDFSYGTKLTPEQIKETEDLVNQWISEGYDRKIETMSYEEAIKSGAMAFFKERYPEKVTVYSFGNVSKEICGGPHVENTKMIGPVKIVKEEAVSSGVRRIYAQIQGNS